MNLTINSSCQKIQVHVPFQISTKVLFEKSIKKSTFVEILDESTLISIFVDNEHKIHLETSFNNDKFLCDSSFSFQSDRWHKMKLRVNNDSIEIYFDKEFKMWQEFQNHFEFNGNNVKVQFIGDKYNIDDIIIKDIKSDIKIEYFTAKLLHRKSNRIFNIIESQVRARFNGIYAPYSPRLIESKNNSAIIHCCFKEKKSN